MSVPIYITSVDTFTPLLPLPPYVLSFIGQFMHFSGVKQLFTILTTLVYI